MSDSDVVIIECGPAPESEPPEWHDRLLEIVALLNKWKPQERVRRLGMLLGIEFGAVLCYETKADRDSDIDWLFSGLHAQLAASDRRMPDEALH